ncbi:MAG: ABC transporter ATP-binding protein [Sedimentisphaerales bacterium]|nr:ABC transporter ATP-binding protein [Sedimentisphaerales bacterium]
MIALQVESLTKRYGSVVGVDEVSFAIEPGEVFGYLGPNGSGKTTTLRCIMGLLKPTQGECRVMGQIVRQGHATQHPCIGYLPGDFRIWPQLTARRALRMMSNLGKADLTEKNRDELAEKLDLNLDRHIGDLSKGNRQKVGVILAFQHKPRLLILDEPTIGLDPLIRQTVMELICQAAREGASVLLSSHDLAEVAAVCDRAAILRRGRLVELAPIQRIVQQGQKRLKIWLKKDTPVAALPAAIKNEIHIVQEEAGVLAISYQGSVDPVLKWIAQFPVERIATPETPLEEAFIQYYSRDPEQQGGKP